MIGFHWCTLAQPSGIIREIERLIKAANDSDTEQNFKEAALNYKKAIDLSESAKLSNYTILACLDAARSKNMEEKADDALQLVRRAYSCFTRSKDRSVRRRFMIYYGFASSYQKKFQYDSTRHFFSLCHNLLTTYPDSLESFNSYLYDYYLAMSYLAQETMSYKEAIAMNHEAIRRYRLRFKKEPDGNYNSLAKAYLALKQFSKADSSFQKSAEMYSGEPSFQAIILCNLTESKLLQNDSRAARSTLRQAERAYQKYLHKKPQPDADTDVERRLRQNLAGVLLAENNLPAAKLAFADFFAYCKLHFRSPVPFRVDTYLALSKLHQREGKPDAARQALNAAVSEAYGSNNQLWEQAVLPRSLIAALTERASFLANSPASTSAMRRINLLACLHDYETIIDLTASLRRGALLPESKAFLAKNSANLYGPALSICYELAQQPGAGTAFQNRAFALFDKQQNSLLADSQREQQLARQYLSPSLQTEFRTLNQRLSQLRLVREGSRNSSVETEFARAEKSLIDWQMRVNTEFPAYGKALHRVTQLSISDYQQELTPDEVLLCYAPTPAGLLVLALDQKTCSFRRVPVSPAQLDRAIDAYRAEVSRDPGIVGAYDNRPARALHTLL